MYKRWGIQMIEDENMQKANRITVLRAKREYQRKKQARQQKQQQMQQMQQQKMKKIIEQIKEENKVNEDVKHPRTRYRSVMCVTTGEIFNTIKDAVKKYKVHSTNISQCCRGNIKHTGKLPDGTPLEWQYID